MSRRRHRKRPQEPRELHPETLATIEYLKQFVREMRFQLKDESYVKTSPELIAEIDGSVNEILASRGGAAERGRKK